MHKNCAKDVSSKLAASALISLAFTVIDLSGYKVQLGGKMGYVDEFVPLFFQKHRRTRELTTVLDSYFWWYNSMQQSWLLYFWTCRCTFRRSKSWDFQLQQADEMQGVSSKLAIRIFYGLVPCILGALSAMVVFFLCPHFPAKSRVSLRSRLWKRLIWKLKLAKDLYQEGKPATRWLALIESLWL